MDPFTIAFGVAGLATNLFGSFGASHAASQVSQTQQQIAGVSQDVTRLEQNQNDVREQAMITNGRRQQLEIMRQTQKQQSMGLQAAVSQNSQFGSGLAGGNSETSSEGAFGIQGVNNSLESGRQMFGLTNSISQDRIQMAGLQSKIAGYQSTESTDQGIASLGGSLMRAAPMLGPLTSNGFGNIGGSIFGAVNKGGMFFQ